VTFQVTVTDNAAASSTDTVTVTVKRTPIGTMRRPGGSVPVFG
jgi:hypothetical protein